MMEIEFHFAPFEEDVGIVGAKGTGKSTRGKIILAGLGDIPYWVYDYSNIFENFGHIVHNVDELTNDGQYIFRPYDKGIATFQKFCNKAFFEMENIVIMIDELHQYVTKQSHVAELYQLVLSGRNKGISSIFITTRPASIPNYILSNLTHVFAYRLNLVSDIIWLRDFIGTEAWLLLPKDKRRFLQDKPELQKFGFIYRNQADPNPIVIEK
jgi:hypothetical protein